MRRVCSYIESGLLFRDGLKRLRSIEGIPSERNPSGDRPEWLAVAGCVPNQPGKGVHFMLFRVGFLILALQALVAMPGPAVAADEQGTTPALIVRMRSIEGLIDDAKYV